MEWEISELWTALRDAYIADATLLGMLGGADSVWLEEPRKAIDYPAILMYETSQTDSATTGPGLYRGTWRHDIYALNMSVCKNIATHIELTWRIPEVLTAGIESTYYRLDIFRQSGRFPVGKTQREFFGNDVVEHLVLEMDFRVKKIA